jgi:Holliday junction resolvasome RuvABC endonuclease subunit
MEDYFLGIDPGLGGAFALVDKAGWVHHASPLPLVKKNDKPRLDCKELYILLTHYNPWIINTAIELVHSMPKQGVVSTFTFGRGYGSLLSILEIMDIPFEEIPSQKWKKKVFGRTTPDKKVSIEFASTLQNSEAYLFCKRGNKPHDGVADAICLAEYSRQTFVPQGSFHHTED